MSRRPLATLLVVACVSILCAAAARAIELPPPVLGAESAAATDDALALRFNPAGLGTRYPAELFLTGARHADGRRGALEGALTLGGFGLEVRHDGDSTQSWALGLAAGDEALRVGFAVPWRQDVHSHAFVADPAFGLRTRPSPWLSVGGVIDHVFEPAFRGRRLGRAYTLALGLRPLAPDRGRAHDLGTRLTLTGDVALAEDEHRRSAGVRVGAELEAVPGLVLRGSVGDHGTVHVGLALRGPRSTLAAVTATRDGDRLGDRLAVSFHDAEEPTVLAGAARGRVAVIRAGGVLGDEGMAGVSLFGAESTTPVAPLHAQLERALDDRLTRGVLLDLHGVGNMAQIEELRPRIERLRRAGKPVVAFLEEGATRGDLYLAGPADRIVTTPEAMFGGLGLRVERRSYRTLLESWGVRIDRTSYGAYKSAYRNFSTDSTPPADRASIEQLLDARQALFVAAFGADRRLDRARLLTALDGRPWRAEDARAMGLVDSVGYREDAMRMLGRLAGLGPKPAGVNLGRVPQARRAWAVPARIAVVYASGGIQAGRSGNDLLFGPAMGAATVVRQLERAFARRDVKAVVLRVESPGGETIASDLIHHATVRLKRETGKPLIVSMGGSAASGGYHISAHADRIYADRFTYTGSIGVLLVKPSLEGWYRKHDVRQEDFERGRYMRGWSLARDWTPELQAIADSATYRSYQAFVAEVADGRKLSWAAVDSAARGRVWMGEQALARRLVDEIGGLEAAIAEARRRAGVPAGEKIRPAEFRRPQPGLVQRLIGASVTESIERASRIAEPGTMLYWSDVETAP